MLNAWTAILFDERTSSPAEVRKILFPKWCGMQILESGCEK